MGQKAWLAEMKHSKILLNGKDVTLRQASTGNCSVTWDSTWVWVMLTSLFKQHIPVLLPARTQVHVHAHTDKYTHTQILLSTMCLASSDPYLLQME